MKKNKIITKLNIIILSLALILGLSSCTFGSKQAVTKNGFFLDTIVTITLYEDDSKEYINKCFEIGKKYEDLLSKTREGSDVYKINNANGQFVEVAPDTAYLIEQGKYYGDLSNGSFDISIGRLTTLWDFQNRTSAPSTEEINSALGFNYKNIEIDGNKVRLLTDKEQIDLGGIAKGFIADKMKEYLASQGVTEGVINLGGNIVCLDKKDGKDNYKIGIQKPFSTSGEVMDTISTSNKSIVTSGDYQRYFEENGRIYHHILNTTTGYPIDNDLDSVTIINSSSTAGDALSTIAFTYGLDKGLEFIESQKDTEAIFITKDGLVHKTSGLSNDK